MRLSSFMASLTSFIGMWDTGTSLVGVRAAEVEYPIVVGSAVGGGDLGIDAVVLPEEAERRVDHRHVDLLFVHHLDPFVGSKPPGTIASSQLIRPGSR